MNPLLLLALILAAKGAFTYVKRFLSSEPETDAQPPGMKLAQSEDCKMAVHECGHAVAVWCCTSVSNIESVSIETREGGHVLYNMNMLDNAHTHWCHMVISLAGVAAEVYTYKKVRSRPAQKDLNKARAAAQKLVALGSPPPPWTESKHPTALPFEKLWEEPPSEAEQLLLKQAYRMARDIVKSYGKDFYLLVSAILSHRTMTEADVAKVLGKRLLMKHGLLGVIRPTFLTPNYFGKAA